MIHKQFSGKLELHILSCIYHHAVFFCFRRSWWVTSKHLLPLKSQWINFPIWVMLWHQSSRAKLLPPKIDLDQKKNLFWFGIRNKKTSHTPFPTCSYAYFLSTCFASFASFIGHGCALLKTLCKKKFLFFSGQTCSSAGDE